MRSIEYYIVDVFGKNKYTGNQLAVFLDFGKLSSKEMQQMAKEINFAESTFISSKEKIDGGYNVRIFTPEREVDFAGHPSLGTAYIINNYFENPMQNKIILNLKIGQVPIEFKEDILWMKQIQPSFGKPIEPDLMASVLGLNIEDFDKNLPIQGVSTGLAFTIVPLNSIEILKKARIQYTAYDKFIKTAWAKGIMIYCNEGYEKEQKLSSRVFVNYLGIPEDPATGSATGCLCAYLLKHRVYGDDLSIQIGQGYEIKRPSTLHMKGARDQNNFDLYVGGNVIEVAEGKWKANGL